MLNFLDPCTRTCNFLDPCMRTCKDEKNGRTQPEIHS